MASEMKILHSRRPFRLESGYEFRSLDIAYHTYGRLNAQRDNVVWVCHALTANSDVADWWPHTVEPGAFLDPEKWFVVCANILGSHYGTTGPLHNDPATGRPWYGDFPAYTIRDIVGVHRLLAEHLAINGIHTLVGSSVGGFQALEWLCMEPERFRRAILIATDAKASPWSIAIDETQRMAILSDATYGELRPDAGAKGLAAARAIGLLTYRGPEGYNLTQRDAPTDNPFAPHRACSYQRHQGDKLVGRFNAYSYVSILNAFDTHDVGRGRGGVAAALASVKCPVAVVGISTDIIFSHVEMRALAAALPGGEYHELNSALGHDGFLVEHRQLNQILTPFIDN